MKLLITQFLLILTLPNLVFAQSLDGQFSTPTDLTDQQVKDSQEFVHQGVKDKVQKKACDKANGACDGPKDGFQLEEMISKAYAMIGMISGGGFIPKLEGKPTKTDGNQGANTKNEITKSDTGGKKQKTKREKGEEKTDWCMMGAMASEMIGTVMQKSMQSAGEQAVANVDDLQLKAMESVRESHRARQKTARFQAITYSTVSACYAAMWATGYVNPKSADFIVKLTGAVALTGLYWKKVMKQGDSVKAMNDVIASMKNADKCDPWTKTSCFCSEPTSKELYPMQYEEICVLNNGNPDAPLTATGCVSQNENSYAPDPNCLCRKTNTCAKNPFKNIKFPVMNASNLMNEANKGLDEVMNGNFDLAELQKASMHNLAIANKVIPKPAALTKPLSNSAKEKEAQELAKHMPIESARMLASSNASPSSYSGGIKDPGPSTAAMTEATKEKVAEALKPLEYEKKGGKISKLADEPDFVMPQFPGMGGEAKVENGTEVISFAEQAVSKADVSNAPETPIFDIISNRYRRSWEKFEPEPAKK